MHSLSVDEVDGMMDAATEDGVDDEGMRLLSQAAAETSLTINTPPPLPPSSSVQSFIRNMSSYSKRVT